METFLTILSGIGWIIVYEECIRLGFKQKTFAMPFFALGLNFAWELIYTLSGIFCTVFDLIYIGLLMKEKSSPI